MALGNNRKRTDLCGVPIPLSTLFQNGSTTAPRRGGVVIVAPDGATSPSAAMLGVVETVPRAAASHPGLPQATDAEEYIVDFGPGTWQLYAVASGSDAINPGDHLNVCVDNQAASPTGNQYRVGDVTNLAAAAGDIVSVTGLIVISGTVATSQRDLIEVAITPGPIVIGFS